jgi:PAS domain S-box-containing protein
VDRKPLPMDPVLEHTPIAQFAIDADHRITHWNRACELLTGVSARDVVGTDRQWTPFYPSRRPVLADLVVENDFSRFFELYKGRRAGPSSVIPDAWQATDYFPEIGGASRHIFFLAAPLFDARDRRIGAVETLQDITELIRTGKRLEASEERYRFLAESVADGIAVLQGNRIAYANPAFAELFDGADPKDLGGLSALGLLAPAHRTKAKRLWRDLRFDRGAERSVRLRCRSLEGREFWVEAHNRVIDWGGRGAVLTTLRDVTSTLQRESSMMAETETLRRENVRLRTSMRDRYRLGDLVGKSPAMQEVYELILKAASSEANVILYGESGTGKELAACAIHGASARAEKPFVPVNCGAIPETLIESEFFGHRKGAFTGAQADKQGFLDLADGGTLFLDEVGELPPALQVKLLRVLEGGGFTALGGSGTRLPDLHIVAATNRDLGRLVAEGKMREDFYYRIHVLPIHLPPLRERLDDLPLLVEHLLRRTSRGKADRALPAGVLEALRRHDWPGNVRELQSVLHRFTTLKRLDLTSPQGLQRRDAPPRDPGSPPGCGLSDLSEAVAGFERRFIRQQLERHQWHRTRAARSLGVSRKTLFRKMKHLGLA